MPGFHPGDPGSNPGTSTFAKHQLRRLSYLAFGWLHPAIDAENCRYWVVNSGGN